MKPELPAKILFLLLALSMALTPICSAQQTSPSGEQQQQQQQQPSSQINDITSENDRLPFMKSEQSAARSEEPGTGTLLAKTLGAMLLVVGLLFFGAWGMKKFGFGVLKPNASGLDVPDLAILSSVSVGTGRTISAIRFGERVLLVGSTASQFTLLAADETAPEKISADNAGGSLHHPRSVADLLGEENASFESELELAQSKFTFPQDKGGRI